MSNSIVKEVRTIDLVTPQIDFPQDIYNEPRIHIKKAFPNEPIGYSLAVQFVCFSSSGYKLSCNILNKALLRSIYGLCANISLCSDSCLVYDNMENTFLSRNVYDLNEGMHQYSLNIGEAFYASFYQQASNLENLSFKSYHHPYSLSISCLEILIHYFFHYHFVKTGS